MKTLKITTLLIGVLLAVLCLHSCKNPKDKTEKVYIDINAPLTGPVAEWGGEFANGFNLGIDHASKKYNIDSNIFSVDVQNNAGDEKTAISAFEKQKLNGYDVFISVSTIPVNAFAYQIDKAEKPHFIAAFDPFVAQSSDERFRVMANGKIEAPLFIDYALKKEAKSVYIVQLNLPYAEDEFGKIVEEKLKSNGIEVIRERFEMNEREFKSIATKIKDKNPDLIFIAGFSFHLRPMIDDLRTFDLIKENGNVVSVMDMVDLVNEGKEMEKLKDIVFVTPFFEVPGKIDGVKEWEKEYMEKYNVDPTYVPAYAYDNATLIVKAYAENGVVNDSTLKASVPFMGINGKINLDDDEDILSTITLAKLDEDGKIVELK